MPEEESHDSKVLANLKKKIHIKVFVCSRENIELSAGVFKSFSSKICRVATQSIPSVAETISGFNKQPCHSISANINLNFYIGLGCHRY